MVRSNAYVSQQSDETKIAEVATYAMGEQEPRQTLRGIVETVWERDASLFAGLEPGHGHKPWNVWGKPDEISGSDCQNVHGSPRTSGSKGTR